MCTNDGSLTSLKQFLNVTKQKSVKRISCLAFKYSMTLYLEADVLFGSVGHMRTAKVQISLCLNSFLARHTTVDSRYLRLKLLLKSN